MDPHGEMPTGMVDEFLRTLFAVPGFEHELDVADAPERTEYHGVSVEEAVAASRYRGRHRNLGGSAGHRPGDA